jgi:hypothetical protein
MISQAFSKALDRPGLKIWHCDQDWNGYATESRFFSRSLHKDQGIRRIEDRIEGLE